MERGSRGPRACTTCVGKSMQQANGHDEDGREIKLLI